MGPQTSNRFGLFELVVCFTSLSHDSSHKDGGLKKMEKKKTDVVALHKARVAQKKEFSRKRCRPRVAAAACEGFWYRVIEALLPGSEGGRRLTAQILFGYVSVCVWKTDEMVLFERRSLD